MSIVKLEDILIDYLECEPVGDDISKFMQTTIDLFKDQSDEIANLRQELAKKEDVIDVNEIKEVRNLNG